MKTKKSDKRKRILFKNRANIVLGFVFTVVPLITAVVLVCAVFYSTNNNQKWIVEQNAQYSYDATTQLSKHVGDEFKSAKTRISDAAYYLQGYIVDGELPFDVLKSAEKNLSFDAVRYVDANGVNYTSDGETSDATDRDYFINGMQGKSGISLIFKSRINSGVQIGFYSPVYNGDEVIGVIRGVYYAENYLNDVLSTSYFGEPADTYLCDGDGRVIACCENSSEGQNINGEDITELLAKQGYASQSEQMQIENAIAKKSGKAVICDSKLMADIVCVTPVDDFDLCVVLVFPEKVTEGMLVNANMSNATLLLIFVIVGVLDFVILFLRNRQKRRSLESMGRDMGHILKGTREIIHSFVIVDLENSIYRVAGIDSDYDNLKYGEYFELVSRILKTVATDEDAARFAYLLDEDTLRERLSRKNGGRVEEAYQVAENAVSAVSGLPISGWANMIIVALEYDNDGVPTKAIFMREDVTTIKEADRANREAIKKATIDIETFNRLRSKTITNIGRRVNKFADRLLVSVNKMSEIASSYQDIPTELEHNLGEAHYTGDGLRKFGENLLDFAKLGDGLIKVNAAEYETKEFIDGMSEYFADKSKRAGVGYIVNHDGQFPDRLIGDVSKIERILENLIDGYIERSGRGTVRLTFSYAPAEGDSGIVTISFEDRTDGVDLIDVSRVAGLDISLTFAKFMADLIGAELRVESDNGNSFAVIIVQKLGY